MAGDPRERSPRLLVLGAGPGQLGLLEAAKAGGVWTAVADRDPAAPGFRLADRRCIVSTEDEPAIDRLAGALELDGIIAPGTDWPVAVAARVADRHGLPHPISPATALLATNKLRQREVLDAAGVPQPRWQAVSDVAEVELEPPLVVKAPDRQGQKGLSLVRSREELAPALAAARAAARGGIVLVEELIEGPEVTVNGFSVDGAFSALAVTDRVVAEPPAFGVALAHVHPWSAPGTSMEMVVHVVEQALTALGIANGPSYTQLRLDIHGHPWIVEVAARLGGGHDAELVEAATGVPLNAMAIAAAVGEDVSVPAPSEPARGAVTRFLVAPPGVLESVHVPDDLDGVETVRIYREPGYVVTPLRRGADRAGAVLAVADTRDQAFAYANSAADRIRFVTANAGALV